MPDQADPFPPARNQAMAPYRSRSGFAGYQAFGSGDGAVLMDVETERQLRSAAESATHQRRVTGGLLFGHGWTDEQGRYLVIGGFLEARPGEGSGDRVTADGADQFSLSETDLRLLRADGARTYPASVEVGWWRTLMALGEFGPRDFATQAELAGPTGVGLLVYGSGPHWGTAYLGPDGRAPDTAGTLVATTDAIVTQTDAFLEPLPEPEPDAGPAGPELVDITAGEHLLSEDPIPLADDVKKVKYAGLSVAGAGLPLAQQARQQAKRRPSRRARRRAPGTAGTAGPASGARMSSWARARAQRKEGGVPPGTQESSRLVLGAVAAVVVIAAVIVGFLLHSAIATAIIAVIGLLVIYAGVRLSRWM